VEPGLLFYLDPASWFQPDPLLVAMVGWDRDEEYG